MRTGASRLVLKSHACVACRTISAVSEWARAAYDLTERDLIVGIGFANLEPTQAVREYEKHGVIVHERVASSLYSGRMLKSFGLGGVVRISPLHCHAPDDIARFLAITATLAANR